jgi:hypothetical protein
MMRFAVTLLFCKGGSYRCQFYAVSRVAAKAQAMVWARDAGFVGAIKKSEVIEITVEVVETAEAGNVSSISNMGG